jgi:hypothetical protein
MQRTISVVSDVKDLSEVLNGASVDQARFVSSGGRLRLEMELTRAMVERQQVIRQGWFKRFRTPWIKSRLVLEQIQDVAVQHLSDQPPEQLPLLACDAIAGGYQFVVTSPEGLRLQLTLEQLQGQFEDIGSPIESP